MCVCFVMCDTCREEDRRKKANLKTELARQEGFLRIQKEHKDELAKWTEGTETMHHKLQNQVSVMKAKSSPPPRPPDQGLIRMACLCMN